MRPRPFGRVSSLRSRFLLVVLIGVLLPLSLVGLWIIRTAERSGEALLRVRLEASLDDIVHAAGTNWVGRRSDLLGLVEDDPVQALLRGELASLDAAGAGGGPGEREAWPGDGDIASVAHMVVLRDRTGRERARFEQSDGGLTTVDDGGSLPVRLPVYDTRSGQPLGTLEASLRAGTLLPSGLVLTGVGGSLLAVFGPDGSTPLLPVPIASELLQADRFTWGGRQWIAVRHTLHEPLLRLVLAAPVDAFAQPFRAAARRGTLALLLAVAGASILATVVTRRATRSLERLAEGADAVSAGELGRTVTVEGPNEVRRVGQAFNTMSENLRRTLQKLSNREALAAMGEFASSIAHEVRNPLTSIRLDLQRAAERADDPGRTRELVGRALRDIDRLDASVAGALRLARTGRLDLVPLDVSEPLAAAIEIARPTFSRRGAEIQVLDGAGAATRVRGDAAALEQLFLNLFLNAAAAVEPGGRATASVERAGPFVRIRVEDDGAGMTAEQAERVFEPFYSTKPEGTGLGLPIARRIATALDGELELESVPGAGTIVTLTLAAE